MGKNQAIIKLGHAHGHRGCCMAEDEEATPLEGPGSRRQFVKGAAIAGAVAAAGLALGGVIPAGAAGGTTDVEPPSYIIYIDATGKINARNGATGAIDYSGTDAATVIQSAITALTSGGEVFIKRGTYQITRAISLRSLVYMDGEGPGSVLRMANGTGLDSVLLLSGLNDVVVCDLAIDGNKANQTSGLGRGIDIVGVQAGTNGNLVVNRVKVSNTRGDGIIAEGASLVNMALMISHCEIENAGVRSIFILNVNRFLIDSCRALDPGNVNVSLQGAQRGAVKGCIIQGSGGASLRALSVVGCLSVAVSENVVTASADDGITLDNSFDCTVTGNVVRDAGVVTAAPGIALYNGAARCAVVGNQVTGARSDGIICDGSGPSGSCNDNVISGNVCQGCSRDGIRLDSSQAGTTVTRNLVNANRCLNNAGFGVREIGTIPNVNVISDNVLYNNSGGSVSKVGVGTFLFDNVP